MTLTKIDLDKQNRMLRAGFGKNERIRELAEQAGYTPLPGFDFANELQEVFLKKFAELIVKKCAYLVNHQQRTTGYTTHARMLCEEFGIEFKEEDYFGVEE